MTHLRCHLSSRRLEERGQQGAREPSGECRAGGKTEVKGCLVTTSHGKDRAHGSSSTKTDPDSDRQSEEWTHYSKSSAHSSQTSSSPRCSRHSRSSDSLGDDDDDDDDDDGLQRSPLRKRSGSVEDDEDGHLVYHNGLVLKKRYEVVSTLGEGAFGKVVDCIDRDTANEHVALKIIKNSKWIREAAMSEIEVLEEINRLDDDNRFACVHMLDWFDHHGHICIVFELLGISTFDFLKENGFLPFTVEQIRHMAHQLFRAICFLHCNKMTHTDLKPENILFVCSDDDMEFNDKRKLDERTLRSLDVKVVDFGSATFDHAYHSSVVSTQHYRAPEVILDLGWSQACDVWSLGCILLEFYLGLTLFQTHDSREHLAMMERVLGPIPSHLLKNTRKRCYVHHERLDWDENGSSGRYIRKHFKQLELYMQRQSEEDEQLFDLIKSMMEYDVSRRMTLEEALWHPFFNSLRKDQHK